MQITKSRPLGVSILAILLALQGIFEIGYGLFMMTSTFISVVSFGNMVMVRQVSPWAFLLSGVLALLLAYGLWTLQKWAFWVTVILEAINLVGGALALFTAYNPEAVLLSMVIPAVILIYFFADAHVREAFSSH